ncbi:hypothetical protein YC2023_051066 [Brassica napus]
MKPDLLYLGAGYPVSRTKLFQGGGYDAAIKPVAEPEVNPKPYSTIQGANEDIHALKMPYLTNKEVLNDGAKPIIGFQKAQDKEKWPQILGVMINFPEPAKPTSSMESLQPIQLGSTQSYLWEPGDHLNQSGGIPEVLSCTRTHRIRRILEEVLKPTRSHLWKDWTDNLSV